MTSHLQENIKRHRKFQGLTQTELAKQSHVCNDYISKIEAGHCSNVGVETLGGIASALGVAVSELMRNSDETASLLTGVCLDEQESILIALWRSRANEQREMLFKFLKTFLRGGDALRSLHEIMNLSESERKTVSGLLKMVLNLSKPNG